MNTTAIRADNPIERQNLLRLAWRKSFPGLAAVALFSVFINILKLATPIYLLQVLDRVVASRSHETLIMLTVITLFAILIGISLEAVRRQMFVRWGLWIERSFGAKLFAYGFNSEFNQSSSASKVLRDLATVRSFVSGRALIAWLDVIWAPLFIACVFLISTTLGYMALTATLITIVLGTLNEWLTRESRNANHKAGKDGREWISSAERNQETIGSANMLANMAARWTQNNISQLNEGVRTRSVYIYFEAAMRFVGRCARIAVLGAGIWFVIGGSMTLGGVFAAGILSRMAYNLVEKAMLRWREIAMAKQAYMRIKKSLINDKTPLVSVSQSHTPVPLIIDNMSYRYPNQASSIFRGITLTLNPGEVLCVIGPSAAGKSTLTRLASGLIAPRSGKIRLGDVDVYRLQQIGDKAYVGHLPQNISLFQGTVRENIAGMAEGDIDQVITAAKYVGVHETILKLPGGYDTDIIENEPLLSAGERKKIAIARAFYGEPPLIVLDEPYPHLDNTSRSALRKAIATVNAKGVIVIITTQTKTLSRIADKVLIYKDNKFKLVENAEEIAALRRRKRTELGNNKSNNKKARVYRLKS